VKVRAIPDHLQVPWGIGSALLVFALAWIGVPVVITIVALVLAPYAPWIQQFVDGLRVGSIDANFILVFIDALGALGLVWLYLRRYRVGWATVGWRKFKFWQAVKYLLAIFVAFIVLISAVLALVAWLIPGFNANQPQTNEFTGATGAHANLALIALVIVPPIIEETVFRGFIFPALSKRIGVIWGAVGSSILFGFAHLQANVSVYTFLLGLLLCFMYVKLKSIYPGMALHMLNNLLAYVAITHS
jgi:membrane protease YdiL (CAAX protease family)